MGIELRILLVVSSVIMLASVLLKIRKSKFQIHDGIFWFFISLIFLVLSIFPQIALKLSSLIGIESPANLVFLIVLAILLAKNFFLSVKVSHLEYKIIELTQRVAIEQITANDEAKPDEEIK